MTISQKELNILLEELERLKLENAILRTAAGIKISSEVHTPQLQVTADERQALFKKTI